MISTANKGSAIPKFPQASNRKLRGAGLDSGYLPQTWVIKPKSLPFVSTMSRREKQGKIQDRDIQ
jgi:hypothetical protein